MPYLAGFVTPQDFLAAGNGTTDDTAAINNALNYVYTTFGGGIVILPATNNGYLVSSTINIPPFTFLVGQTAISLNLNATPTNVSRLIASATWAPSSTTGIVSIQSKTPGGWSVNTAACGLRQIYLDGSLNSSSSLQGINMVGPVYDVHLEDVYIYKAPHNAITASGQTESGISPTYPYHQRWDRVNANGAGNTGFNLTNFTDSTFSNCLVFGSNGSNYVINNMSNSQFVGCRAEWSSTSAGYAISGSSGTITFTGCTTDQNAEEGFYISSATGQSAQGGGIVITGGKLHADGWAGTSGRNNGINISSSTVPVTVTGVNVESGQNVNNSSYFPANAVSITSSSNVAVTGCVLQGIASAWNDGGGNTFITRAACLGATGNPNTQTFTQLIDYTPEIGAFQPQDLPTPAIAWNFDPAYISTTGITNHATTLATVTLLRVNLRYAAKVTNVLAWITAAGGTLTSGENFAGLYSSSGTRIATTADQTTAWAGTGLMTMALSGGPYTLAPGFYWVALLANGTTAPTFANFQTPTSASSAILGGSVTGARSAMNGTGTSLPASITPSSNTNAGQIWWAGLS